MAFTAAGGSTSSKAGDRASLRRESGSALLIVLAFVAIMAVVLLAFLANSRRALQQSQSSATIVKTQMLGELATAAVIDDLLDEMKAGADEEPAAGAPIKVTSPAAMLPHRVLKAGAMANDLNFVNLVKQSASGLAFFPMADPYQRTGAIRASAHSTETPAKNQRKISAERWNKPRLLGTATGVGSFSTGQLPDWIYITRNGVLKNASDLDPSKAADKAPSNTGYVLGRFAYNIYQVGGLLDINVAGYSPSSSASAVHKGSAAWADLQAIPGLDVAGVASDLVEWRNKQTISDYARMVAGLPPGSSSDAPGAWGEPGGFLKPYTDGSRSDNRFFGRQDLLRYVDSQFDSSLGVNKALPFLTTFSADLDQPSFRPDPDRPKVQRAANAGGNDAHGDESGAENEQINPAFLSVLDGGQEPVVKRRFPLDRLKYVYPDPEDPGKVEEYFGLTWNDTDQVWTYVDGDSIKRLHQISGREPNMIELLKAAIATGSLGGQFVGNEVTGSPRLMGERDASTNYHIMRIAAAIIDQYDGDSYPTRIQFGDYVASGVEDLPYLYGLRVIPYRQQLLDKAADVDSQYPVPADATGGLYRSVVMIQPILWNPHALLTGTGARPTEFRVTAGSGTDVRPKARVKWWPPASPTGFFSNWPEATGDSRDENVSIGFSPGSDYITFSATQNLFREPYALTSRGDATQGAPHAFQGGAEINEPVLPNEQDSTTGSVIGFRAGWSWSGPWKSGATSDSGNQTWLQEGRVETNGIDFEVQYQAPSGRWITYDSYEKFTAPDAYRLDRLNSGLAQPWHIQFYLRGDPRVDRYGARGPLMRPRASDGIPQGASIRPGTNAGLAAQRGWPTDGSIFNFTVPVTASRFWGQISENKTTGDVYYGDPDGIVRPAMGGSASGLNGLPMASGNPASRPVVLNRPFRSVAELGNVLRDQPWKQLDFFSPSSGDAALLDLFCVYEPEDSAADPIVAGRVNLNTKRPEVIEALLRGVELQSSGGALSNAGAKAVAEALTSWTASTDSGKGPLRNRSELVGRFLSGTNYSGFSTALAGALTGADAAIPLRRQNALRALTDAGTTRAWTFLIDLIVQDGQFVGTNADPGSFVVRGEKRYWIHVSMDRFTGKVITQRVEEVYE